MAILLWLWVTTVLLSAEAVFPQNSNMQMAKQFDNLTVSPTRLLVSSHLFKYAVD